jgi:hypothetical protein
MLVSMVNTYVCMVLLYSVYVYIFIVLFSRSIYLCVLVKVEPLNVRRDPEVEEAVEHCPGGDDCKDEEHPKGGPEPTAVKVPPLRLPLKGFGGGGALGV